MTALIPYTVIVSLLAVAFAPLACAYALYRVALLARDPSLRLPARRCRLWVHCASVGEARLALRLVDTLAVRGCVARGDVVLTATNPAAVRLARASHPGTYLAPVDHLFTVRRTVRAVRPEVLVVLETELWPCYIAYARMYGARVFLANGRISASTAAFLRLFRPLFSGSLDGIHRLLLREPLDAVRFRALGIPDGRMAVAGNMKYDETIQPEGTSRSPISRRDGVRTVVFGSVREGEERLVCRAAAALGAPVVELHTGPYAHSDGSIDELGRLAEAARLAASLGLEVHAGHGLSFANVGPVAALPELAELNIGHFLIGEAVFIGLEAAIAQMRAQMESARA